LELPDLFRELRTGLEGLTKEEARNRLSQFGPNELPTAKKASIAQKVFFQARNLFNVLLLVAAFLSFPTGSPEMGFAILGVVVFNIGFNIAQERRAEKVVEALHRLIPANAKVSRDGEPVLVPVAEMVPGDVFVLEEGDRIPADARLLSAFGLTVDQSVLTGEPSARERSAEARPDPSVPNPADCPNLVLAGTTVATGTGTAVVISTGARTTFGRIVTTTYAIEEPPSPLQRQLGAVGKLTFEIAFAVGFLFLAVALIFRQLALPAGLLFMIGVMIDMVPEGLQLTVTLALVASSLSIAKRHVVVKRLSAVETLGSATVICTDKTGTVTTGQMTVRKLWIDGVLFDVTGLGYDPQGRIVLGRQRVAAPDREDVRRACEIAALDNKATLTPPLDRRRQRWTALGDSTDAALVAFSLKGGFDAKRAVRENPRVALIPFDSTRKMMTSIHRDGSGRLMAYSKGAAQVILERSTNYLSDGQAKPLEPEVRSRILAQVDAFAREAYRVLALAFRELDGSETRFTSDVAERDLTFVGLVAIYDPPRADVPEAVLRARGAGVRVIMLTGDHELTAEAIGRRVGILSEYGYRIVSGERLAAMTDDELDRILDIPELIFARITPDQKFRVVRALRGKRQIVAVTGDGVNDTPALAEADVGIAMGITGTDVARETADLVLLDDNFASIVAGVEQGRGVFDNLRGFMTYVYSHNFAEFVSFVAFVLLNAPLAITVILVLAIDLVMEIPISLALTVEPPAPDVMRRPPRPAGTKLFDLRALLTSIYVGTPVGILGLLAAFAVWSRAGWSFGSSDVPDPRVLAEGATVAFAAIMFGQIGNMLSRRAQRGSAFTLSSRRNRWLLPGVLGTLAILVAFVYVPPFQAVLGTAGLSPLDWGVVALFTPLVLGLEEARKFVVRRVFPPEAPSVPAAVPAIASNGLPISVEGRVGARARFERGASGAAVLLALFLRPESWGSIPPAIDLASNSGSRLIIARIFEETGDRSLLEPFEDGVERLAKEASVEYDYLDLRVGLDPEPPGTFLSRVARETSADTILIPVAWDPFPRSVPPWLEDLSGLRVILVRSPPREDAPLWPHRILIPVLEEFHQEPFDLAAAFTASAVVPEVDVVAARVIQVPPIVPLYSTYRPESLVDADRELSFLRSVRNLTSLRFLRSSVVMVRQVGRDVVDFARERDVDTIILAGDWRWRRQGFLGKAEREIAENAHGTILIVIAPRTR
jgi:magnesium-transporting ATPase (P-type)